MVPAAEILPPWCISWTTGASELGSVAGLPASARRLSGRLRSGRGFECVVSTGGGEFRDITETCFNSSPRGLRTAEESKAAASFATSKTGCRGELSGSLGAAVSLAPIGLESLGVVSELPGVRVETSDAAVFITPTTMELAIVFSFLSSVSGTEARGLAALGLAGASWPFCGPDGLFETDVRRLSVPSISTSSSVSLLSDARYESVSSCGTGLASAIISSLGSIVLWVSAAGSSVNSFVPVSAVVTVAKSTCFSAMESRRRVNWCSSGSIRWRPDEGRQVN